MPSASCTRTCWTAAAVIGLLVWIFTAGFGALRWYEGLVLGLVAFAILAAVLIWLACRGVAAEDAEAWQPSDAAIPAPADTPETGAEGVGEPGHDLPPATDAGDSDVVTPSGEAQSGRALMGEEADRNDIYGSRTRPAADDLKQIKGIGPKIEELLHLHGITRFDQIAAWDDAEIEHYAALIGPLGTRIRNEDWVGQARALQSAGATTDDGTTAKRAEEGREK